MAYPRGEIATIERNLDISPYPLYGKDKTMGGFPLQFKDRVARDNGFRLWYDIYWDLLRDPHCSAVIQKRIMEVIGREWLVMPSDESRKAKKIAERFKAVLDGIGKPEDNLPFAIAETPSNFDRVCADMLMAVFFGFSVGEIIWGKGDGTVIKEVRSKLQSRFSITIKNNRFALMMRTLEAPVTGIELPPRKFIFHSYGADEGNPYGFALAPRIYYPVTFKRRLAQFSLSYADKFADPVPKGNYKTPNQKDALVEALSKLAKEGYLVLPDGVDVEMLVSGGAGNDVYKSLIDYFDGEMSKATLGETGSTDQQTGGGSRARDEIGNSVRISIAKYDADLLSATLNNTLAKWWTFFNYGPSVAPPTIWRKFPEIEQLEADKKQAEEDAKTSRAGRDATIVSFMQLKPTREYVEETYDIKLEEPPQQQPATNPLAEVFGMGGSEPQSEGGESPPTDSKTQPEGEAPTDEELATDNPDAGSIGSDGEDFAESELDAVYNRYHELVNMTAEQLKAWGNTKTSTKASLDRSPLRRNIELLTTTRQRWTDKHVGWANKTIGFISRMKAMSNTGGAIAGGLTKRDISLLNWGYNPTRSTVATLIKRDKN
jgi:hypothetical protein